MDQWRYRSSRGTYVLLVASFFLIGPTVAGVSATLPLLVAYAGLAVVCWAGRDTLRQLPVVAGYDLGWYARDSWLGAVVAAGVGLAVLGAPPAELQAAGGFVGLAGMVNYFLRPLYLLVVGTVLDVVRGR
jgi:hypothetical protein